MLGEDHIPPPTNATFEPLQVMSQVQRGTLFWRSPQAPAPACRQKIANASVSTFGSKQPEVGPSAAKVGILE